MRARPFLRRLLVLSCVVLATGSVAATLEAQEGAESGFSAPTAAVPTPDGAMLVADYGRCVIERIDSAGARSVVAGQVDKCGAGPDGVPATETRLDSPTDAVPLPGGGFLVASQTFTDCRIRKVGADGIITTVAGTGVCAPGSGDGGPATEADITAITAVPFNPPGQAIELPGEGFLITSTGDCDVRHVDGDGNIDTVAGNHTCGPSTQHSLDCAPGMCAVGLDFGLVSTTTNPTAPAPEWENARVNVSGLSPEKMSCPSASFCATIDAEQIHASTNANAANPSWSSAPERALSIECTSPTFCVAGDAGSAGLYRSENAAANSPVWEPVPPVASDVDDRVAALDCVQGPGTDFCAAATQRGELATTTNASADDPTWNRDPFSGEFHGISCPSTALCVAAGGDENLYVSTNPSAADPTWDPQSITNNVVDVSCPSVNLCVAIDDDGRALTSTDPQAAAPTWTPRTIHAEHGFARLSDVSCASESLCTAIETGAPEDAPSAHLLVTTNPGAADPVWVDKPFDAGAQDGASPTSQTLRTPVAAVPTADGGFLVTEVGAFGGPDAGQGSRVRKVSPDGDTIRTVAGTGVRGYSGDGGPATAAQLYQPTSAVPTPDGGFLVSEISNCVVRKVGPDGIIRRVAGVAPDDPGSLDNCGTQGTGGPATSAQLQRPTSAVTFPDGSVVIGSFGVANDPDDRSAPLSRMTTSGTLVDALSPFVAPGPGGNGPGGGGPGTQPPGGGSAIVPAPDCTIKPSGRVNGPKPKAKKRRKKAKKPGVLKNTVTCTQAAAVRVSARLTLKPKKKKGRKAPKAKRYTLKAKNGTAPANKAVTVRLRVPKKVLRSILRGGKGSIDFALAATGVGGTDAATANVKQLRVRRQR